MVTAAKRKVALYNDADDAQARRIAAGPAATATKGAHLRKADFGWVGIKGSGTHSCRGCTGW
jgi:hypothetical protein